MEWLKLTQVELTADTYYEAAVIFYANDDLQTIDRNGVIYEFDCSIYRENLKRFVVYLDDTYTRGINLKFSLDTRACITI